MKNKRNRNRTKSTSNPPVRLRSFTRTEMILGGTQWQRISSHPLLNRNAIRDAVDDLNVNVKPDRAELFWLANSERTKDEMFTHFDVFAARYPRDARWNAWRRYRRTRNAVLS